MNTQQFCDKVTRMLSGKLKCVQEGINFFHIETDHVFIENEPKTIKLSEDGRKQIEAIVWRNFRKFVAYSKTGAIFWFEDTQK